MNISKELNYLYILFISIIVVMSFFYLEYNLGFSQWDEGYLWYGSQRVAIGEVPFLDFMSYDPGRYYWSSGIMNLFEDYGILNLRFSIAIFQIIGVYVGLLLISNNKINIENYLYLFIVAIIFILWMVPRHKIFDISISIFTISLITYLIKNPTKFAYFLAGFGIGLIAFFGRNHGVYGLISTFLAIAWIRLNINDNGSIFLSLRYWFIGLLLGYSPMILMIILVPNFDNAFIESILFLIDSKTTNLPLPVPWPWLVDSSASFFYMLSALFTGIFFVGILLYNFFGIIYLIIKKINNITLANPLLVATFFVALPYSHYAYSRADLGHLAHAIFPLIIGFIFLFRFSLRIKWILIIGLLIISFLTTQYLHPFSLLLNKQELKKINILDDEIYVNSNIEIEIELLKELTRKYGNNFLAVPFWPGSQAIFKTKSPIWEIYALFPRTKSFQDKEINDIKLREPNFIIVNNYALDGRNELKYENTHSLIYSFILENYNLIQEKESIKVFVKKENIR